MRNLRFIFGIILILVPAISHALRSDIDPQKTLVGGGSVPIISRGGVTFGYYSLTEMYNEGGQFLKFSVTVTNNTDCHMMFNGTFYQDDTAIKFISWGTGPGIQPGGRWTGEGEVQKPPSGKQLYFAPNGYIFRCPVGSRY